MKKPDYPPKQKEEDKKNVSKEQKKLNFFQHQLENRDDKIDDWKKDIEKNNQLLAHKWQELKEKKYSFDELKIIIEKNIIPKDIINFIEEDYFYDDDAPCPVSVYYELIANKVLETENSNRGYLASLMLSKWDKGIEDYYNENPRFYFPDDIEQKELTDEEKRKIEEKVKKRQKFLFENDFFKNSPDIFNELYNFDEGEMVQEFGGRAKKYLFEKIKNLNEKNKQTINNLIDFIKNDNFSYWFIETICDVINNIDSNKAVGPLLEMLNSEKVLMRANASYALHRLEFGKIGISEEGVKYLEKIYDLGEYNNPDYHVSRLTADGEIGIFNEEKELIKYFHLGDLSSPEKKTQAKVLDFVYDTLFIGKLNETQEEKQERLEYLEEFKQNYYKIANEKIFTETGVRLNNLSFKEQGWFIINFNESSDEQKEDLRKFVAEHGEQGIKTFLSLESDQANGDKILNIGEKLDKQVAERVFEKFNQVSVLIQESNQELSKKFFNNNKNVEPAQEILKRASKILTGFEQKITELNYTQLSEEEKNEANKKLLQELTQIKKDVIFFTSMFKTTFKGQELVDFNEVRGVDFETVNPNNLSGEDKQEILNLAHTIYGKEKEIESIVKSEIEESFNLKEDARWYVLKKDDKIISTIRAEDKNQDETYLGSFMVKPEYAGSAIGNAMEQHTMDVEASQHELKGVVEMRRRVASHYVNTRGWVVDGITLDNKTGVHLFNITRNDELNPLYKSKQENQFFQETADAFTREFNNIPDEEDIKKIQDYLNQGFVITKLIRGQEKGIYIFEKQPQEQELAQAA